VLQELPAAHLYGSIREVANSLTELAMIGLPQAKPSQAKPREGRTVNKQFNVWGALVVAALGASVTSAFAQSPPHSFDVPHARMSQDGEPHLHYQLISKVVEVLPSPPSDHLQMREVHMVLLQDVLVCLPQNVVPGQVM
jgi:hypothetical protein